LLIITKTDLVHREELAALELRVQHQLAHLELEKPPVLLTSEQANLSAKELLRGLALRDMSENDSTHPVGPSFAMEVVTSPSHALHLHTPGESCSVCDTDHGHGHAAKALWWPIASSMKIDALQAQVRELQSTLGAELLRLKGRVQTAEGRYVIQLAPFETQAEVCADELAWADATRSGFTVIVSSRLNEASAHHLAQLGISSLSV
jgi:G3E family GTPase